MRIKIVHKASHWSKHGKRRGRLAICIMRNRGPTFLARVRPDPMFATVGEAVDYFANGPVKKKPRRHRKPNRWGRI